MNLGLSVIIDGLSDYKPVVRKISDKKAQIRGFHYYLAEFTEPDPEYMYVAAAENTGKAFCKKCPKHLIIIGSIPDMQNRPDKPGLPEKTDTLIQIPESVPVEAVVQTGNELLASHEAWYNSLLMAVITHKPIDAFLNIAVQRMSNPIVVFNNNLNAISSAGSVAYPVEGTNWEIVNMPGFVLDNFYTPQELRKISSHIAQKNEQILVVNPKNDPAHSSWGILIWIDGKLYGGIGTVDMNRPFTEGQKEIFTVVAQVLKLYFQNHSIYMRIAENKANWLDSLLSGVDVSADIISNYLSRSQWKLDDYFCVITLTTSTDLKIPIISILDIKQITGIFPDSLVSVYEEYVVIVIRCTDRQQPHGKKRQQLEQFLKKDVLLHCGVSMVFSNFLHLRYYYIQSKFAASQCKPPISPIICSYEDCQTAHVLQTLSLGADLRCFCHPGILSLWESGNDLQRDIVHCLYHYFLNGRYISAAADALHIHRNTLIYRLTKAEEILNVDIKKPSVKQDFLFIISCLIVQNL
ncbi:MAG: helix-turn-helix domain-containing protein [Treponema sp.]|jgi:hypothetical protein|nr:helix-turn-helix domain-containing protein [Treponema sp.]